MLEERLDLALTVADGAVVSARLTSQRALGVLRALTGRPVEDALRRVPLLFPLCAQAQQIAALEAVEAGAGLEVAAAHRRARRALVLAEALEGHARALWVEGAALWGGAPSIAAWARLRHALAALTPLLYPDRDVGRFGGGRLAPDAPRLGAAMDEVRAALAPELLPRDLSTRAALVGWAEARESAGAKMIRVLHAKGWAGLAPSPRLCPELPTEDVRRGLAAAPDYPERPTLDAGPAEAGPLARQRRHPLVADVVAQDGPGFLARLAARLTELTEWPETLAAELEALDRAPAHPAPLPPRGDGCGLAETGRGRLAHHLAWADGVDAGPAGLAGGGGRGAGRVAHGAARPVRALRGHGGGGLSRARGRPRPQHRRDRPGPGAPRGERPRHQGVPEDRGPRPRGSGRARIRLRGGQRGDPRRGG